MGDYRNWLLVLHIVFVACWVGADAVQYFVASQLRAAPGSEAATAWARVQSRFHERYYPPIAIAVLTTGILLVIETPWDWSHGFVWVGIGVVAAAAILGGGVLGSLTKRRVAALESGDLAVAEEIGRREFPVTIVVTLLPLVAIMAMVMKWWV